MTDGREHALLTTVDPFVALEDGRRQLLAALNGAGAEGRARTLAAVAAHDDALREVALAFAQGARDFSRTATPLQRAGRAERAPHGDPSDVPAPSDAQAMEARAVEAMHQARRALLEAMDELARSVDDWLEVVVETPWGGRETWRMHLVSLAMHDGAQAYALTSALSPGQAR